MQQEYYFSLFKVVSASARDNPQLRKKIYGLARTKLRQQLNRKDYGVAHADRARHMLALETAIEQIETDLALDARHAAAGGEVLPPSAAAAIEISPPTSQPLPASELQHETKTRRSGGPGILLRRILLPIAAVVILCTAIYATKDWIAFDHASPGGPPPVSNPSADSSPPQTVLPTAYGVYASVDEKLVELEPSTARLPDRGNASDPTVANRSKLTQGRIQFIAFKRDLANNAPEKVKVNGIMAAVEMGDTASARPQDGTAGGASEPSNIRRISYDLRVAPVEGNAAMIIMRAPEAGFLFPAGDYVLTLKGIGYKFSVAETSRPAPPCALRGNGPGDSLNKLCSAQ
jgi:hypothetical protein